MVEHINTINALSDQVKAILDLMECANDSIDANSVNIASDMCLTMQDELDQEVQKIFDEWKAKKQATEAVKTVMCDEFCKYPCSKMKDIGSICDKCPLDRL